MSSDDPHLQDAAGNFLDRFETFIVDDRECICDGIREHENMQTFIAKQQRKPNYDSRPVVRPLTSPPVA